MQAVQQLDRQKYIGGSDVAAILGISPWRSPLDVYLDKIEPRKEDIELTEAKRKVLNRGTRMEPYVVDLLQEETGLEIVKRGQRYKDKELDFIAAEIDAEAASGENIEIKTVSPYKAKEWGEQQTDAIPVHYTAQAMHGLMVTGKDVCVFGVLIGGDDFRIYQVERDNETIAAIREKEIQFWECIKNLTPPEAVKVDDVLRLYGEDKGSAIEANANIIDTFNQLRELEAQGKFLKSQIEEAKERIQLFMQDSAILTIDGLPVATWKTQTANRFNQSDFKLQHPDLFNQFVKSSSSRVFRLK